MNKRQHQQQLNKFYAWREKVLTQVRKKGYEGTVYPATLNFLYLDKTSVRGSVKLLIATLKTFK